MDKEEGKRLLESLRSVQEEIELTRVHVIELQNLIMILSGVIDHGSDDN
ncbi:MAG: hypothetical protein ACT6FG_00365 [Methanosarcinaceae archaeon]